MLRVVVPLTVLVINAIVVHEVRRRASSEAASNLGLQHHHQSTSSNSAVPTVMLVTTSLIYALLNGLCSVCFMARWVPEINVSYEFTVVALSLWRLVDVYNFYVYLITGKQFRSELFCGCHCSSSSSSSSSSAAVAADANVRVARYGQADTAVWNFMHWCSTDIQERTSSSLFRGRVPNTEVS